MFILNVSVLFFFSYEKYIHILHSVYHDDHFENQLVCDVDVVKNLLFENDESDWDISRYKSDKLRYYNLFKSKKEPEEYINLNSNKYHRSLLAQFRCGILPIQIEVGRYRGLDLCLRICPVCELEIEDEIHFLCKCKAYDNFRNALFRNATIDNPEFPNYDEIDKFRYLLSEQQRSVMKFLSKAISHRASIVTVSMN